MKAQRKNIFACDHDVTQKKEMFQRKLSELPINDKVGQVMKLTIPDDTDGDEVSQLLEWLCASEGIRE